MKRFFTIPVCCFFFIAAYSQIPGFSIGTDVGLQRNFKPAQRYWAFGNTVQAQFHLDKQNTVYTWFSYYSNGKFKNDLTAQAKEITTIPQTINYRNDAKMRLKQLSIGWKKFLTGSFDEEKKWSIYAYGGFGILLGRITNVHSVPIDTNLYALPVLSGKANFKRLTFDLGAGVDIPLINDFYLYFESRVWIPASDYPSKHILVNNNAPYTGMLSGGIRLLF